MVDRDNLSDNEDWQNAKEQLDEKDLLMRQTFAMEQCLEELRLIRASLSAEPNQPQQYKCEVCDSQMPESEIESHAKSCFGWMAEMGKVTDHFEEV